MPLLAYVGLQSLLVGAELQLERHALAEAGKPTALKFGEGLGDKYKVRIISAGEGSSGIYPIDMLERDVPAAFPEGTRMKANHDGLCEDGGDIRRVIARTIDTPWREGDGMWTNILVAEGWSQYVREFGDIIGLSISAAGDYAAIPEDAEDAGGAYYYDAAGDRRKKTVEHLYPAEMSPYNSIDFVEAPGADGRIVAAIESARAHLPEMNVREAAAFAGKPGDRAIESLHRTSEADAPGGHKEDIEMDEQTLRSILAEERAATVAAVEATVAEASKPADAPVEKPTLGALAEAVATAGLTEFGRQAVYEAVDAGKPLADAIEREKAREAGIRKAVEDATPVVQHGYVTEAGSAQVDTEEFADMDGILERIGEAR